MASSPSTPDLGSAEGSDRRPNDQNDRNDQDDLLWSQGRSPIVFDDGARSIDANDPLSRIIVPTPTPGRDRWWIVPLVAIVIYGPIEKFALPAIQGYLSIGGALSTWRPDLEALQTGFIGFPAILGFYAWSARGIPELLRSLHSGKLFVDESRFEQLIFEAQGRWWWFSRLRWTVLSFVVAAGLTFGLFMLYLWDFDDPKPVDLWFTQGGMFAKAVALLLLLPVLYAAVQVLIREVILAYTLRRVWRELGGTLLLHSKKDDVGGLDALAGHVSRLIMLVTSVFITFAMASALPALREEQIGDFVGWIIVIWAIYLVMVPGIFGGLIWPAHRAMQTQRDRRLAEVAAQINTMTRQIEKGVQTFGDEDRVRIREGIDELERLRQLHAWLEEDLPTWPVAKVIRKQVTWTALLPIVSTAVPLLVQYVVVP